MRVLITDGMDVDAVTSLKAMSYDVVEEFYDDELLGEKLKEFDIVVVRSATKIRKKHLDLAKTGKLKLIIRAGVGIDNIDHQYAESLGILVKNTPNASSLSVAELALSHIFSLARFIPIAKLTMADGKWNKKQYKGIEITGKTIGIVGLGRIGFELAKLALALNMKVLYTDIKESPFVDARMSFVDKDTLLREADFVSLHLPKLDNPVLNIDDFKKMKNSSFLINCARGGVVKEADVLYALDNGLISGYGVDVFEQEPTNNEKLAKHERVSITPHIGAQTKDAQKRVGEEVVSVIKEFKGGK